MSDLIRPPRRTSSPLLRGLLPSRLGLLLSCGLLTACLVAPVLGQGSARDYIKDEKNLTIAPEFLSKLEFASLGFSRGGRATAVAGVVGEPLVYYFGSTGGGVWKTTNGGLAWKNVTDGSPLGVGSIGAIAVAESDHNVVYVGTGSACPRGNISNGDGMYKSTDGGQTWQHIGLPDAGQIGSVVVHPKNPDLVYVAVLGNIFGPNEERGLFRSKDGGATWNKVLFLSDRTGFVDIAMDANNPRVLYAAAWRAERKPWTIISGSEEGGVWKSTDSGDNWTKLEGGLPDGLVGKIGVAVSPADSSRVWVLIEAEGEKGGLYRSDDAGKKFRRLSGEAKLRQRPWYYTHVYADPKSAETVYVLNTDFYQSTDGGRTFERSYDVPHGDNHDLWINPNDAANMINSNDGGANITFDGGTSWSWQMNQPTAEIYRLTVDEQWPYRVYGSQQDNSTISVPSYGFFSWDRMPPEWYDVGGCESGHIAVDPRNPDIVYAGCYGGSITRSDHKTGEQREVILYPQLQLGQAPRDLKYRFQWNAPIRLSPHDPDVLYHTSQIVHRSTDAGQSWSNISPDLTTNNQEQQDFTGGPISHDSTGVEVYNVIFAFEESPHRRGELWAGSDDGRLHVSRNSGASWTDVTPKDFPAGATINMIEISSFDPDRLFIAAYKYRENDFHPYIFRTDNGGKSWKLLTDGKNGIPATHFTRVVREDTKRKGLLFAGTEFGLYVSFDDGAHWQPLQNNLPVSPVTDLAVHRGDLVVATQGRAFWALRDLSPLRQVNKQLINEPLALLAPGTVYRGGTPGKISFAVKELPKEAIKLEFAKGEEILYTVEWDPEAKAKPEVASDLPPFLRAFLGSDSLKVEAGLNQFTWNLRRKAPDKPADVVHWGFAPGVAVPPGDYTVTLRSGDWSQAQPLHVEKWPTLQTTQAEFDEQYEMGLGLAQRLDKIYTAIRNLRALRSQVEATAKKAADLELSDDDLKALAEKIGKDLTAVEEKLTQPKSKSGQDPLNFPPMLDNQFVELYAYVVGADQRPPKGAYDRLSDLDPELNGLLAELLRVENEDVAAFNQKIREKNVPAVAVPPKENSEKKSEKKP